MRPRYAWITLLTLMLGACEPVETPGASGREAERPESIEWDIPITVNPAVAKWLNYYQTRGRASFEITLRRSGRYEALMREIFREADLPEDLVYLPLIESGFHGAAYSRARAAGLWQFVPATARIYNQKISHWVDERLDPGRRTTWATSIASSATGT
jgi:membrane-bound lytic murein transglycosylase D